MLESLTVGFIRLLHLAMHFMSLGKTLNTYFQLGLSNLLIVLAQPDKDCKQNPKRVRCQSVLVWLDHLVHMLESIEFVLCSIWNWYIP